MPQALLGTRSVSGTRGCWNPYCFPLEGLTDIGASVGASERNEWLRAAWKVTVAGVLDPRRLVFVDECGTHASLAPIYGYSPKGERVRLKVPRNRGKNTTLLASMSTKGMGPRLAVEGSTTAEVFETYLEHFLAPELKEGQVVVMDNLPAHKPDRVR